MDQSVVVEITDEPKTIEEFIKLRDCISLTPEGAAAYFLIALKVWLNNEDLGSQALVTAVAKERLSAGNIYKGYELLKSDLNLMEMQLTKNPLIINSYIDGSAVDNGYSIKLPFKFIFTSNPYSGDKASSSFKVFIRSSGADSPRPILLKKNDKNIWKASEWSSVLLGVKKTIQHDEI